MATATVLRKGFLLKYENKGGTFSFPNLKIDSTDETIFSIATAFNSLQIKKAEMLYKIVEEEIKA